MDFVATGAGGGGAGSLASSVVGENGPILYSEPNRTSAIDDIRSVVIYIFIITIFLSFFLILPGIRNDKLPTFLCITTSLIVTAIILVSLFGTTWHVADADISAAYKAFSRDRIQGELKVNIGLQSVNITLRAHKYYILDATNGPIIMENAPMMESSSSSLDEMTSRTSEAAAAAASPIQATTSDINSSKWAEATNPTDTESEFDEVFEEDAHPDGSSSSSTRRSRSTQSRRINTSATFKNFTSKEQRQHNKRSSSQQQQQAKLTRISANGQKYTIKRVDVDINYNERFYWIGPNQMRQEYHQALERGLPYPILTVVEYLSQDDGGFSWSRQYRLAGYYSYICLWLSLCVCLLMFVLHCAAPKYGIYAMQAVGCLLLFTDFTYATLVPRGEQKLEIPFEGQSLRFHFGLNFWMVFVGGCLSLSVGTIIVIIDSLFPNFIFTTVLDVDYDSRHTYHRRRNGQLSSENQQHIAAYKSNNPDTLLRPPFYAGQNGDTNSSLSSGSTSQSIASSPSISSNRLVSSPSANQSSVSSGSSITVGQEQLRARHQIIGRRRKSQQHQHQHQLDDDNDQVDFELNSDDRIEPVLSQMDTLATSQANHLTATTTTSVKKQRRRSHTATSSDSESDIKNRNEIYQKFKAQKSERRLTTTTTSRDNNNLSIVTSSAANSVVDMSSSTNTIGANQVVGNVTNSDPPIISNKLLQYNQLNNTRQHQHHHYYANHVQPSPNTNLKTKDHRRRPNDATNTGASNDVRL